MEATDQITQWLFRNPGKSKGVHILFPLNFFFYCILPFIDISYRMFVCRTSKNMWPLVAYRFNAYSKNLTDFL